MVFTVASRAAIAVNDPTYLLKLRIRGALTVLLIIPLGCLLSVAAASSNFQSPAWKLDTHVWACLPLIIISLIWNVINIAVLTKWKRPLNPLINIILHALLTLLFIIIGGIATHDAATASSIATTNPYEPAPGSNSSQSNRRHLVKADNGTMVLVTPDNVKSCPAFASCNAQELWMHNVQHRASIAVAGCAIFFLCLPIHILFTALFIRDYKVRLATAKETNSNDVHLDAPNPPFSTSKHPYINLENNGTTTSQVHLLHNRQSGSTFNKPMTANDSAISVSIAPPWTVTTTSTPVAKRPRWGRPRSNGPSLPFLSLSRTSSMASSIASRRSRKKIIEINKDLPPVPQIKPEHRSRASAASALGKELNSPRLSGFPPSPQSPKLPNEVQVDPPSPNRPEFPKEILKEVQLERPIRTSSLPQSPVIPSFKMAKSAAESPKTPDKKLPEKIIEEEELVDERTKEEKSIAEQITASPDQQRGRSIDRPLSHVVDPLNRESFDYRQPELTALPEGTPKISFQSSRPGSPTGRPTSPFGSFADLDALRSLRGTLFGPDGSLASRSSMASSGHLTTSLFGNVRSSSGRVSPFRERAERRALEAELTREKLEREKELLEAEQRAHRAAEKMESAYLRDEMARLEEKEEMRRKRIQERVKKLMASLEELKREQEEEELRQREKAEKDRLEEEEFQKELRAVIGSGGNGTGLGSHSRSLHARLESYSKLVGQGKIVEQRARSRDRLKDVENKTVGSKTNPTNDNRREESNDGRRYSWEDEAG